MILGLHAIGHRISGRTGQILGLSAACFLVVAGGIRDVERVREMASCRSTSPFEDPRCSTERERNWMAAVEFLRDSVPPGAVVATLQPAPVFRISGQQGIPFERLRQGEGSRLLRPEGPVSHVLVSSYGSTILPEEPWAKIQVCERLRVLKTFPPGAMLLAVAGPDDTHSPGIVPGCAALREFNAYVLGLGEEPGA
jgi:hypothetical protein